MAIHGTGSPLSMSEIQTEFGGSNPISMSEYYAGGDNVPSGTSGNGGDIPSSGAINFNIFYTAAKSTRVAIDRKSTRLNSSHGYISYAVFCLENTTELQSRLHLVCRLLLEKNT